MNTRSTKVVTRNDWLKARLQLLRQEKALTKARDALTEARMNLPRVKVETDYEFTAVNGRKSLSDLFCGHSQLIVQHFMFGADWDEGCPSCSFWADGYNGIVDHLNARDISMVVVSTATIDRLEAYRKRMGWSFEWLSAAGCDFNRDFAVSFSEADLAQDGVANYNFGTSRFNGPEAPGISVFQRDPDGAIYHTYSTYGRGLDVFNNAYQLMDIVPRGRDEAGLAHTMSWLRRRDQYSAQ